MISLRVLIVVALFLLPSCSTLGPSGKGPPNKTSFSDPPASTLFADTQPLVPDRFRVVLIFLALGIIISYIRSRRRPHNHRKRYQLSDQEIALVGLASDTMQDLWRLLQAKPRSNVIPFAGD